MLVEICLTCSTGYYCRAVDHHRADTSLLALVPFHPAFIHPSNHPRGVRREQHHHQQAHVRSFASFVSRRRRCRRCVPRTRVELCKHTAPPDSVRQCAEIVHTHIYYMRYISYIYINTVLACRSIVACANNKTRNMYSAHMCLCQIDAN